MPIVSVIVPVYKAEAYIDRCVQALLAQSFSDFELILVVDGSPDRSGELCDAWAEKDARIRVVHQKNQGASASRNVGLDHACGDYVMFCDSDDMVSPQWIAHLYQFVKEDCFPLCSYCNDQKVLGATKELEVESGKEYPIADYFAFWKSGLAGYLWNGLFDRKIIEKNHLRMRCNHQEGDYNEDLLFNLQYVRFVKKIVYVGFVDYLYDIREGSLSRSLYQFYYKKFEEKFKLWYNYLSDVQSTGWKGELSSAMLYYYFVSMQMAFDARDQKKFKEIICSETVQFCLRNAENTNENERLIQMAKKKQTRRLWLVYQLQAWKGRLKK